MKQDEELWMKKMKEALKDHAEPPPPSGWQHLEKELNVPVRRKIYHLRWWGVAATLLIAVSLVSLFFLNSPVADEIRQVPDPLATLPDVMPENREPESVSVKAEPAINPVLARSYGSKREPVRSAILPGITNDISETEQAPADQPHEDVMPETKTDVAERNRKKQEERTVVRSSGRSKLNIPSDQSKTSRKSSWTVGVSVSNISSLDGSGDIDASHLQKSYTSPGIVLSDSESGVIKVPNDYVLDIKNGVPNFRTSAVSYDHRQPITFGLSVRKNLAKGFSVESGVNYTLLSSDIKYADGSKDDIEQKLHYIGIPVRANWSFIDSRHLTLYVAAGGMIEKSVYGKQGTEKLSVKEVQFSVSGAVGAQFNVSRNIGLYVEPGVAYFFDDGSDVETIRKESPFNFNLQAGLRFTY